MTAGSAGWYLRVLGPCMKTSVGGSLFFLKAPAKNETTFYLCIPLYFLPNKQSFRDYWYGDFLLVYKHGKVSSSYGYRLGV
jgi:hypothetical protein